MAETADETILNPDNLNKYKIAAKIAEDALSQVRGMPTHHPSLTRPGLYLLDPRMAC